MTFCDNLLKSFSENLKQLTKINDFLLFLRFHENRGSCTVFNANMNSACKNTLVSEYLLNFIEGKILANFIKASLAIFSQKFENVNFALFVFSSI